MRISIGEYCFFLWRLSVPLVADREGLAGMLLNGTIIDEAHPSVSFQLVTLNLTSSSSSAVQLSQSVMRLVLLCKYNKSGGCSGWLHLSSHYSISMFSPN